MIMTKVGLYSVLRVYTLMFGVGAGELAGFAWQWLLPAGIATLLMAAFGTLAAVRLRILTGYLVLVSAGTLFIAFALAQAGSIGAGLYYLSHSTFVAAALFLIVELVRQQRGTDRMNVVLPMRKRALAGSLFMICAIAAIGLPPLSGFVGKVGLLQAVPEGRVGWVWSTVLLSSLFVLVAMARAGSKLFWVVAPPGSYVDTVVSTPRRTRRVEIAAIVLLLAYGVGMTLAAGPVLRYTLAAGGQLVDPGNYIDAVRAQKPAMREP